MAKASLIVSLGPDGELQIELPWSLSKEWRTIPLTATGAYSTIYNILQARARSETALGSDGAPTLAQVEHWEKHAIFRCATCAFCKAEARVMGIAFGPRRRPAEEKPKSDGKLLTKTVKAAKAKAKAFSVPTKVGPTDPVSAKTLNLSEFFSKRKSK